MYLSRKQTTKASRSRYDSVIEVIGRAREKIRVGISYKRGKHERGNNKLGNYNRKTSVIQVRGCMT